MASGFNTHPHPTDEGRRVDAGIKSTGRYNFYKVRLYGTLHFVKTPAEAFAGDLLAREALRKEFMVGYPLNHPSIVRYLRLEDDAIYEEYIDGTTLREMIDNGDPRLRSPRFVESVARQLLEGVEYMHLHGVLHLDLKPENIMITRIGDRVKIVDLGCAVSDSQDSTPGFTLSYRAPEQDGAATNCYTDIYLTGRIIGELAGAAGVSRRWRNFVRKATADNPRDRFASDRDAILALPSRPRRSLVIAAIAAVAVIAGLIATLILYPTPRPAPEIRTVEPLTTAAPAAETAPVRIDTVYITTQAPPPAPTREDTLRIISRLLETKLTDYFVKNVFPVADDKSLDFPDGNLSPEHDNLMQKANMDAVSFEQSLCDSLGRRYPAFKDYIESQGSLLLNAQLSAGGMRYISNVPGYRKPAETDSLTEY